MVFKAPFSLPSFKPLSRSSSPAPPPPPPRTPTTPQLDTLSAPNSPPKDLRGRNSSDLPPSTLDHPAVVEGKRSRSLSRPLGILSIRSSTPLGTPNPSPKLGANTVLPPTPPVGGGPATNGGSADAASYMEAVGLRMSEGVNKALAGSLTGGGEWKGRKGLARGSGKDLGLMIVREFPAPPIDHYVLRAIVRTSVKYLSVFATRLETVLLPAVVNASFSAPILAAAPHTQSLLLSTNAVALLNPCQTFALSLAHAAFELHATLATLLANHTAEPWPKHVTESFKPVMDKLESVVGRVVQPLLISLKRELGEPLSGLKELKKPEPSPSVSKIVRVGAGAEPIPSCLTPFAHKVETTRRVLEKISSGCGNAGEGWVVGVVVSSIWKGMLGLVERPVTPAEKGSPRSLSQRLLVNGAGKVTASGTATSPADGSTPIFMPKGLTSTKSATNVASLLRSSTPASRPSSPPRPITADQATCLVTAFESLVRKLVDGLVPYKLPAASDPGHLAREALAEALEALQSLRLVVLTLGKPNGLHLIIAGLEELKLSSSDDEDDDDDAFLDALDDVPPILLFLLFGARLASLPLIRGPPVLRPVPEVLGSTIGNAYLAGFGAAEEWERRAGTAMRSEVEAALAAGGQWEGREEERLLLTVLNLVVDVI